MPLIVQGQQFAKNMQSLSRRLDDLQKQIRLTIFVRMEGSDAIISNLSLNLARKQIVKDWTNNTSVIAEYAKIKECVALFYLCL